MDQVNEELQSVLRRRSPPRCPRCKKIRQSQIFDGGLGCYADVVAGTKIVCGDCGHIMLCVDGHQRRSLTRAEWLALPQPTRDGLLEHQRRICEREWLIG